MVRQWTENEEIWGFALLIGTPIYCVCHQEKKPTNHQGSKAM